MIRILTSITAIFWASSLFAEGLVATRTIRPKTILTAADVALSDIMTAGAVASVGAAVGMEARVILYPGRPIFPADLIPAALIERNQIVELVFRRGGLRISTEARALDRASAGDTIRFMNLSSRTAVSGFVLPDGSVIAAGARP